MQDTMIVRFWGVRGSVPTPLRGADVLAKIGDVIQSLRDAGVDLRKIDDLKLYRELMKLPFAMRSTYGGNTTCVEIRCGLDLVICDMGTGIRELGKVLLPEMKEKKGLRGTILQSHVHWDHIQGLPFFGPLYVPREFAKNDFQFFGGKAWEADLETVLRGQMHAPVFPVDFEHIRRTSMSMTFSAIHDRWTRTIKGESGSFDIRARVLNHPQETFGYRVSYKGKVVVFTTDHEPYAEPDPKLIELVRNADVWITDCQYSHDVYAGANGGIPRLGWGHSFPEYIAATARLAQPKLIVTTHHDPDSDDQAVEVLAKRVAELSAINTIPAYEGLELTF